MEIAGFLMGKGVDFGSIIDNSFYKKTYVQNQIMGRALLESITFLDGKAIFSALRQSDLDFYGVTGKDLDGIIDQLRLTEGVEVAIFLYETGPQQYKVSLRSQKIVDVSQVAFYFGGGGHVRAAGCTMSGSIHDVINNLSLHIAKQLDAAAAHVPLQLLSALAVQYPQYLLAFYHVPDVQENQLGRILPLQYHALCNNQTAPAAGSMDEAPSRSQLV